jgi:hypothetical protein
VVTGGGCGVVAGECLVAATASNVVFTPIEQAGSGLSLTVDGAGYGLTNSFLGSGWDHGIFAIQNTGDSSVVFENLTIGKSTDTGVVIEDSNVEFRFSTIKEHIGAGIKVAGGSVRIQDSFIDDSIFGIQVEAGTVEVLNSIIQSHGLQAITITGDEDTAVHVDGCLIWSNE